MPPIKLAHVVLETPRLPEMRDWYVTVLEAVVAFENRHLCFLQYDDEHHRMAFVRVKPDDAAAREKLGHISFAYGSLEDLLANHDRLAALGIRPYRAINHGPTTSLYYRDPDGNGVETQVDNSTSVEWLKGWFQREEFATNPIGVPVDVEDLRARLAGGEPIERLLMRPDLLPDGGD